MKIVQSASFQSANGSDTLRGCTDQGEVYEVGITGALTLEESRDDSEAQHQYIEDNLYRARHLRKRPQ